MQRSTFLYISFFITTLFIFYAIIRSVGSDMVPLESIVSGGAYTQSGERFDGADLFAPPRELTAPDDANYPSRDAYDHLLPDIHVNTGPEYDNFDDDSGLTDMMRAFEERQARQRLERRWENLQNTLSEVTRLIETIMRDFPDVVRVRDTPNTYQYDRGFSFRSLGVDGLLDGIRRLSEFHSRLERECHVLTRRLSRVTQPQDPTLSEQLPPRTINQEIIRVRARQKLDECERIKRAIRALRRMMESYRGELAIEHVYDHAQQQNQEFTEFCLPPFVDDFLGPDRNVERRGRRNASKPRKWQCRRFTRKICQYCVEQNKDWKIKGVCRSFCNPNVEF